jgi:hypothetical protein
MSRGRAALEGLRRSWVTARQRHWDLAGGPGPVLRWAMRHRWVATLALTITLVAVLGVTFGIPPFSPLVLVVLLVAPFPWWLRAERRLFERWQAGHEP